jgi:hypothetical protein
MPTNFLYTDQSTPRFIGLSNPINRGVFDIESIRRYTQENAKNAQATTHTDRIVA